jgi:hypothetical protein
LTGLRGLMGGFNLVACRRRSQDRCEFLAGMGELFRIDEAAVIVIARSVVRPASVKNNRGKWPLASSRIRPRAISPLAIADRFGLPAPRPLRQVSS